MLFNCSILLSMFLNAVMLSVYSIIDIDILLFSSSMLFGCSALVFWHPRCVMLDVDFVILVPIQLFVFRILFFHSAGNSGTRPTVVVWDGDSHIQYG